MSRVWSEDDNAKVRGIGSAMLSGLTIFVYMVLRLIEARQAHFIKAQGQKGIDVEKQDTKSRRTIQQEDDIDFAELEDTFFQVETEEKRPALGVKANIRIFTQAMATVAFSCHTSASLPIALIGIIASCVIIFLCLWVKQLNYVWMSDLANVHLYGTLFFVICASTTAVTMLVWAYHREQQYADEDLLAGYLSVMKLIGSFSLALAGCLIGLWMYKRKRSYERRKGRGTNLLA